MALAAALIPGYKYRITGGLLQDEIVTIVNNKPFPDGHEQQRKITVTGPNGQSLYILPRLLEGPIAEEAVPAAPVFSTTTPLATATVTPIVTTAVTTTVNPITDPMDPRLDHLRPSRAKVRRYFNRDMPNGMTDVEFLLTFTTDAYRAKNEGRPANVMLKGDTQAGKTFLVEVLAVAWADAMGLPKPMPIFTLSGSAGITDYDLFGQTTSYTDPATGQESLVWLPGIVDLAAQVGGILYLDEVNAMAERVTSSLHPLADHRHMFVNRNKPVWKNGQFMADTVVASADLWIIGTYNDGNYRGMSLMNEAFINRFRHIRWGYDDAIEVKLIDSQAVRLLGQKLRLAREGNQLKTPVGTTALQHVEEDIAAFGIAMGIEVLIGMFQPGERAVVEAIIEDGSILVALQEEQRQARLNP